MSDTPSRSAPQVQQFARAEQILDGTLAYQAAQAVHQLKIELGIDVAEIRVSARASMENPGSYLVTCTVLTVNETAPIKLELVVPAPTDEAVPKTG